MTEKTLWIHAGGGKAGSSALQSIFEKHHLQLRSLDIAYENRARTKGDFEISSGNGFRLYDGLSPPIKRESQIDDMVLRHFGEYNNALCSCEHFTTLGSSGWRELYRSSLRLGLELKVIFYVRNAVPLLLSGYDQAIKRTGESQTFADWVVTADWQHPGALRRLADEIPLSNLIVLSYDRNKENLIRSFLAVIDPDSKIEIHPDDQQRKVNRSLTNEEREILIKINSMGETFSAELSDLLIYKNPMAQREPAPVSEKLEKYLLQMHGHEADWINTTFFSGQPVVSVLPVRSNKPTATSVSGIDDPQHTDVQQIALSWAIEKLRTIKTEATIRILDAAATKHSEIIQMGIPADFDPVAYLALNPDLVEAGVDPFRHFVDSGRNEKRRFKFKSADEYEAQDLHQRIEVLKDLLKQSVMLTKETLRQAKRHERELSSRLASKLMRNKAGYFSNWFRRRRSIGTSTDDFS